MTAADGIAESSLDGFAGDRADQLVAAHPDVTVDLPDREDDAVLAKGQIPGHRMVVVRVDERAVDVEQHSGRHLLSATRRHG